MPQDRLHQGRPLPERLYERARGEEISLGDWTRSMGLT